MTPSKARRRIFLIGNANKPRVQESFDRIASWLDGLGLLAGSDLSC